MPRFASWKLAYGLFGAMLLTTAVGELTLAGDSAEASSDNWRRTAHGWERLGDWKRKPPGGYDYFVADEHVREPATRWDIHPAAAVLLQGAAIALAFAWFERPAARSSRTRIALRGGEDSLAVREPQSRAA